MNRLLSLIVLICLAVPAAAQDCTIAAYFDPEGTISGAHPGVPAPGSSFFELSIYVVLFTEDTVAAAAYALGMPHDIFVVGRDSGIDGNGLVIDEPTGTNVALRDCVIGFGGLPVLIDRYDLLIPLGWCGFFELGPNTNQDPEFPQYVTCNDLQRDCGVGPGLFICDEFPTEGRSFGAIKSLYHKD